MEKTKIKKMIFALSIIAVLIFMSGCGPSSRLPVAQRRQIVSDMETETLQRLYREKPSAKDEVKKSAGYGVFANANINLLIASAGSGYGVVVDNATGDRTYMKMALGGIGLGLGVKDYRQVLIFNSKEVLTKFVDSGWEFGGHADAAAKAGESGAEASGEGAVGPIKVYAMTKSGLALQATVTGTKYWKDKSLN